MTTVRVRRWLLALAVALVPGLSLLPAQTKNSFNEREIAPALNVQDKEGIWALHFRFFDPRILTADVPGEGRKIVWYMRYSVMNITPEGQVPESHTFVPDFELVSIDRNTVHRDVVIPAVQDQIAKIEDPTGRLNFKNSVTISQTPIPPSRPNAVPTAINGLAIWTDVYDRARDTNRFDVFVSGLSNGWSIDDKQIIRRKTLELPFKRLTDERVGDSTDIRFLDNPGPQWIYRATNAEPLGLKPSPALKPPPGPPPEKDKP
jgi:hypothetical protein